MIGNSFVAKASATVLGISFLPLILIPGTIVIATESRGACVEFMKAEILKGDVAKADVAKADVAKADVEKADVAKVDTCQKSN